MSKNYYSIFAHDRDDIIDLVGSVVEIKGVKKIHFMGICGYLMSALAVMMKEMGYQVTGSDQDAYPPTTTIVERAKIKWAKQYDPANLKKPDLVVIGGDISRDNPEAQAAFKKGLEIVSLAELIGQIFAEQRRIVVAGTHGKTTTTSLIAWVLKKAGLKPSYLVGGLMANTKKGFQLGKGDFLVVEGDEYRTAFFDSRPKFFHYRPEIAVLTTCEMDHPDYFENLAETKKIFGQFLKSVPPDGLVVGGIDDPRVAEILQKTKRPKITYGLKKEADYQAKKIKLGEKTEFKVSLRGKEEAFSLFLPGKINLQNALAAIAVADYLKIERRKIKQGVKSFLGVKRRFEIIGQPKGITIIDDYAHHPTKIKKTLAAARTRYPENKIWVVFEPHTYSRTKTLINDYARAFGQADEVIISQLMPAREAGQKPTITSREVVEAIGKHHSSVRFIAQSEAILDYLVSYLKKGEVVMVMSVGGLNNLAANLKRRLAK